MRGDPEWGWSCKNYTQENTNKLNFTLPCSQVTPSAAPSSTMPLLPAADREGAFLVREEKETLSVSNRLFERDSKTGVYSSF